MYTKYLPAYNSSSLRYLFFLGALQEKRRNARRIVSVVLNHYSFSQYIVNFLHRFLTPRKILENTPFCDIATTHGKMLILLE